MSYTNEQKLTAIRLYLKNNKNANKTVKELGYPSERCLINWYKQYKPDSVKKVQKPRRKYTEEEKNRAVELYFKNGCNLKKTVRELGYGSQTALLQWLRKACPDRVSKPVTRGYRPDVPDVIKQQAILDLISGHYTQEQLCDKYHMSRATLYSWQVKYIGKGDTVLRTNKPKTAEDYKKEIADLKLQKELIQKELEQAQKQLYKAQLEKDVYEKAAEILKKEMGCSLKDFSNREKAMVIAALKNKYSIKEILGVFDMAKSSYFYQKKQLTENDKYESQRARIIALFYENKGRYGYRRIHVLLKREGIKLSEKIVRRIMKDEHLEVQHKRKRKYSSYKGEITPAVENIIDRNFHSAKPNQKWLTDITEFTVGDDEKVYLSPIIDCFDGMPIAWTAGTSPNANLVNTMLDQAISNLRSGEHPIVHSDRGCHYRWPGWIERMEKAGLTRSMSKKGCSPDNSACEGFFGRMKNEMYYGKCWNDVHADVFIKIIDDYMTWYRTKRVKISLGGMSPLEYRRSLGIT